MIERAYAKINLCLDVVKKRDDGYHEMNMIMVPINFYDVVKIEISDEMKFESNARYIGFNEKNTIYKAIKVLREEYHFKENFHIKLTKHIPTQAGLAGGSADGAATLRLINKLLKLNISDEIMNELAKKVGADVPFCMKNQPAQVSGIGEKLDYFSFTSDFHVFLVKPYKGVSTKTAFNTLNFDECSHPNIEKVKTALINQDYDIFVSSLGNTLEYSAFKLVPEIKEIKKELISCGFDGVLMSGSGSTVFAITKEKKILNIATKIFRKKGYFTRSTAILK